MLKVFKYSLLVTLIFANNVFAQSGASSVPFPIPYTNPSTYNTITSAIDQFLTVEFWNASVSMNDQLFYFNEYHDSALQQSTRDIWANNLHVPQAITGPMTLSNGNIVTEEQQYLLAVQLRALEEIKSRQYISDSIDYFGSAATGMSRSFTMVSKLESNGFTALYKTSNGDYKTLGVDISDEGSGPCFVTLLAPQFAGLSISDLPDCTQIKNDRIAAAQTFGPKLNLILATHKHADHLNVFDTYYAMLNGAIFAGPLEVWAEYAGNAAGAAQWGFSTFTFDPTYPLMQTALEYIRDHMTVLNPNSTTSLADVSVTAVPAPGHTVGQLMYLVRLPNGDKILVGGDSDSTEQQALASLNASYPGKVVATQNYGLPISESTALRFGCWYDLGHILVQGAYLTLSGNALYNTPVTGTTRIFVGPPMP